MSLYSPALLEKLFSYTRERKHSLHTMEKMDLWQGHPHRSFRSIHVAGTNGKGSVSLKIATALQKAGFSVGLYTSPHLISFHERIVINGEKISESLVEEWLPPLFQWIEKESCQVNFFEIITTLAFRYFAQQSVDFAVIEAGLGGRLDATNIIHPILSVITSIGYDHTHILGETLEEIAEEKAGIAKPGVPLVLGPSVEQKALLSLPTTIRVQSKGNFFDEENQATARVVLKELSQQFPIGEAAIVEGVLARPACRFEQLQRSGVDIVLDVAHNPSAFQRLLEALSFHFPKRSYRFVVGISKDKDIETIMVLLSERAAFIHCVDLANHPRLAPAAHLASFCVKKGCSEPSLRQGFLEAFVAAERQQQVVVICGSFFIMAAVKQILGGEKNVFLH